MYGQKGCLYPAVAPISGVMLRMSYGEQWENDVRLGERIGLWDIVDFLAQCTNLE